MSLIFRKNRNKVIANFLLTLFFVTLAFTSFVEVKGEIIAPDSLNNINTVVETSEGGGSTKEEEKPAKTNSDIVSNFNLQNPLKAKSLVCLLYDIINGIMGIMAIVAALYIIYSGFLFISSQGNPEGLKKAKTAFFNAVIGTGILLGAWAITAFIVNVLSGVLANDSLPDISKLSC